MLVTFLVLIVVLRAPLLAALAVGLNLALGRRAFGVITLLCKSPRATRSAATPTSTRSARRRSSASPSGSRSTTRSSCSRACASTTTRDGDNAAAIEFGLEKTAGVITGAAAIMAAVFVSFAGAPIATVSQMGVGLTVAILLDATVVRIVLLPALMLLLGDRVWRLPGWLHSGGAAENSTV